MKKLLSLIIILSLIPSLSSASFLGFVRNNDLAGIQQQIDLVRYKLEELEKKINFTLEGGKISLVDNLGATSQTIAGTVYTLSGSGVSGSATTIGLTSLTLPQSGYEIVDGDLPATFYLTLEPGSRTRQEIVSCTTVAQSGSDTTATLSGCTRGLLPISDYTASSSYQFAHAGGTSAVFSNPPQLYETLATKSIAQTITGVWTFSSTTIPRLDSYLAPTNDAQFAPKKYADDLVASGVADGNYSTFGGYVLATTSQVIAGTATSTATRYLVLSSELANTTSSAKNIIPVTKTNGKLSQGFLDLTEGYTFSGGVTSTGALVQSGTSTFSGVNTISGTTTISTASTTFTGTNVSFAGNSIFTGASTFNGNVSFATTTTSYTNAVLWQYLGASSTATTATNAQATAAIVNMWGTDTGCTAIVGGTIVLTKVGSTVGYIYPGECNAQTDLVLNASWSGNTITLGANADITINSNSIIYWYK